MLKSAYLNAMLADLDREEQGDERLFSEKAGIRRAVRDYYSGRRKTIAQMQRAFDQEQRSLGMGRSTTLKQKKTREKEREASKDLNEWIKRTRDDYMALYGATSKQQARAMMRKDKKAAQNGDPFAYLRLNGYTTDDENTRLELDECHYDEIRCFAADLLCEQCGKPHCQEIRAQDQYGDLIVPICAHCKKPVTTGELKMRSWMNGPRGIGKTQVKSHGMSQRISVIRHRGHWPEAVIIGENDREARKLTAKVKTIMQRPGHRWIFDKELPGTKPRSRPHHLACIPRPTGAKGQVLFYGNDSPVIISYGITGIPPGYHADIWWIDDAVNYKNTILKPSGIQQCNEIWDNVITKSFQPWTNLCFTGTAWRDVDLNARLRALSKEQGDWSHLIITCGGPEDGFSTPSPKRLSSNDLKKQWDMCRGDTVSYDRAYRMKDVSHEDIAFRDFHFYACVFNSALERELQLIRDSGAAIVSGNLRDYKGPKICAIDVGFTGPGGDTKGRSQTAIITAALYPDQGFVGLIETVSDFYSTKDVKEMPLRMCRAINCKDLICALGPGMEPLAEYWEEKGKLNVFRISETKLGNKALRKFGLADWHNSGLFRFRVWPAQESKGWTTRVSSETLPLYDACRMSSIGTQPDHRIRGRNIKSRHVYVPDLLDAYEFLYRHVLGTYGRPVPQDVDNAKGTPIKTQENRFFAHQEAIFAAADKKPDDHNNPGMPDDTFDDTPLSEIASDLLNDL